MTQPESLKVWSPPHPGSTPPSSLVTLSTNSGPLVVTVNVTHWESAIRGAPKYLSGLPKSLRPWANRLHSAHDCPGFGGAGGAMVIVPVERSAAWDPVVTSTMSSGATATELVAPFLTYSSRLTVIRAGTGSKPMSLTRAPVTKFTFFGVSQATSGFTKASFWLKGVRITPAMVDRWGNK